MSFYVYIIVMEDFIFIKIISFTLFC